MSPLDDAIMWIGISTGFLLCLAAAIGIWYSRRRGPLMAESYHADAERAYRAAGSGAAQAAPAK